MRRLLVRKERGRTDGTSSATPAIIPRPVVRSVVVSKSTSASPTTSSPPPTATLRSLGPLAFAYIVESQPAIAFGQCTSIALLGTAHLFFFLLYKGVRNTRRGSLCFD
jgi:hypothetical protein